MPQARIITLFAMPWFAISCIFSVGCSSKVSTVSVKGKVLVDGKALSGASVTLHGAGGNAAVTDDAGEFAFKGDTAHAVVKPGEYAVVISKYVDKKGKVIDKEELDQLIAAGLAKETLPARYSRMETTQLKATIKDGDNILPPFVLKGR